jgi:hypothetical protein
VIAFQLIAVVLLSGVFVKDLILLYRRRRGVGGWIPVAIWLAAAIGIAYPNSVTWLARGLGIHRGADLVLYVSCLAFVYFGLWLYSRSLAIERKITMLVRQQAIQQATLGGESSAEGVQLHGAR